MSKPTSRAYLLTALSLVVALAAVVPAHASYDKLYRFKNLTGNNQTGVFAVLNALEAVGAQYTGDLNPWGAATPGILLISGVYCTTLAWDGGATVVPDQVVKIGWNTTDHNCHLRDMNWGSDTSGPDITNYTELGDIPGGGLLKREGNNYVWTFTNDTDRELHLPKVGMTVFRGRKRTLQELARLADRSIAGPRPLGRDNKPMPDKLGKGDQFDILIPASTKLEVGDSLVLHGRLVNAAGQVVLDWIDQAEVLADLEEPTASATEQPNPDGTVTVTLTGQDASGIAGFIVAIVRLGAPPASAAYYAGASVVLPPLGPGNGQWDIQFRAIDKWGNASPQQTVRVTVP